MAELISFPNQNQKLTQSKSKGKKKPHGLRERWGDWHYRIVYQGQEYSGNTGLRAELQNVNDALAIREQHRQEIISGLTQRVCPFNECVNDFLPWVDGEYKQHPESARRIRTSFASLTAWFQNKPLKEISAGDLERFKTWRRSQGIKEVTIRHDLHNLSTFFQYAIRSGWTKTNLVNEIDIPSDADAERAYILTPEEEARYFAIASTRNAFCYDVGRLMVLQGIRPEEAMTLEQVNMDFQRRHMRITWGKSRAAKRTLRMMPETFEILSRRVQTPGRWVFPSPRKPGRPIQKLINPHNEICSQIGLEIVMYDFRHTFATRRALAGCPLPLLASIMGHSSLRCVMRYIHPNQAALDNAMSTYSNESWESDLIESGNLNTSSVAVWDKR